MTKGFSFRNTILTRAGGSISTSEDKDNVADSLRVILNTRKGDRAGMPTFGCNLPDRVFDPNDLFSMNIIRDDIIQAIRRWEPRVRVRKVILTPDEANFTFDVDLRYEVIDRGGGITIDEIE